MAEWSKAADLSSVIRTNAWVRTPLVVFFCDLYKISFDIFILISFIITREWCSWLSRQLYTLKVPGSSPGLRSFVGFIAECFNYTMSDNNIIPHGVVGNISACHADARGSIPRLGVFFSTRTTKVNLKQK